MVGVAILGGVGDARRRRGPGGIQWTWVVFSGFLHLVTALLLLLYAPPPEPERPLLPVTVLAPEPTPPPPQKTGRVLHLRPRSRAVVRETIRIPLADAISVPPPPDVVFEAQTGGGGLSLTTSSAASPSGIALSGIGSGGGGFAGSGGGIGNAATGVGGFGEYVGGLRQAGLDVVFAVDATGSMGWLIVEVKERVRGLAAWTRNLVPVTRFGVVAYRDRDDPEFVTRVQPLTLSVGRVRRFLDELEALGRGDAPEAVDEGLRAAVEEARWHPDSHKVIILLGDAPPHAGDLPRAMALAEGFRRDGGMIAVVDTSFDANPHLAAARLGVRVDELQTLRQRGVMAEFQRIAQAGGGSASTLEEEGDLSRQLALAIFGEHWAEELRPLLEDL